jgi:excinuclease ABC subunit C
LKYSTPYLTGLDTSSIGQKVQLEDDVSDIVSAFVKQYYSDKITIPKEILVENELADKKLLEEWLSGIRGNQVKISVPRKGDKKELLNMAKRDVIEMMKTLDERANLQRKKEVAINDALESFVKGMTVNDSMINDDKKENHPKDGWRVEAYDISNTNGIDTVGGMVVFKGSKPQKKDYRRFKIRTVEGPNDFGSLQEVLYRRFKRGLQGGQRFSEMPDLIMVDGGKAQVSAAEQVLRAMKLKIPVAGMVKDNKHKTRGLIFQEKEYDLKDNPILYRYVATLQEEVHRFAVDYHRSLRKKSMQKSILDSIEGIGEKRRNALLAHFGSVDSIKEATYEELRQVPGITKTVAENLIEWAIKSKKSN